MSALRLLSHTRPYIKEPGVPGAYHSLPINPALPQWSTAMRTKIVDGMQLSVDIAEAQRLSTYLDLSQISRRRRFFDGTQLDPFSQHSLPDAST